MAPIGGIQWWVIPERSLSSVNSVLAPRDTLLVVWLRFECQVPAKYTMINPFRGFLRTKYTHFKGKSGQKAMSETGSPRDCSLSLWAFRSAIPTMCRGKSFLHLTVSYNYRRLFTAAWRGEGQYLTLVVTYYQNMPSTPKIRWRGIEGRCSAGGQRGYIVRDTGEYSPQVSRCSP